ncbi:predicted protein [Uncinocarpus reesii 1704]|uniref:Man(5)GlcNAc(2)-PP-dolichol translocation protein RFT1 n=1 Tax=Uncinocarpus reesii (strain UAMH 1704) TaxID=336963 RepID=C4JT94_UNCRE|nr:uncharacterized protein UREG_05683 [Uncinocarpus reesii 1704]EEP80841.1 predicted protein [Uncinocarpus reesii 1704]
MGHAPYRSRKEVTMAEPAPRGAVYLIGIQIFSRAMTFSANQVLLLHVSPVALGMSMQLDLYSITVLHFARESIRMASQTRTRAPQEAKQGNLLHQESEGTSEGIVNLNPSSQEIVNMSYLSILLGSLILYLSGFFYLHIASEGRFSLLPVFISGKSANVFFQSAVKHILTQGDAMILAALSSLEDQGLYALASNYGGLVARLVFQPIEESSRISFGRWLSEETPCISKQNGVNFAKSYLQNILHAYSLLTITLWTVGPLFLPAALKVLLNSRWAASNIEEVLLAYCYYIPFLAFNGITEAFVSSAASNSQLRIQATWMGACSVGFAFAAYFLLKVAALGIRGLVWANIVNMAFRIVWSFWFIKKYFVKQQQEFILRDILPRRETCAVGAIAWSYTLASHKKTSDIGDLARMIFGGAAVSITMYVLNNHLFYFFANTALKSIP